MGSSKLAILTGVLCLSVSAQNFNTGTFLGTVTDASQAAVSGVTVRIVRTDQPLQREVITGEDGTFLAPQLPAGVYRVEFDKTGFQRLVRPDISLSAGQSLRVDGMLKVGAVTETVEVDAKVAQVDTATANVGNTIYGTQVQELALNTRSFTQLMTLQPGVNSSQAQQPGFGSNTSVPFSFNGGQTSSNNWTLDGGRNIDTYNGNNLSIVNLDAIAEVRIERNAYSAEYGRNSGAQVNVITKSGSNDFHGTLFEFFRNDKLDARNFFAASRPKNRYNNFGGTVGGPIVKNKVFFFLSNEYRRIYQNTGVRTGIVPTDAQIAGNFAGGRTITDPITGQPYPGNVIPAAQIDPNAVKLIQTYFPRPTPGFSQGALNYTSSEPDGTKYRSGLARVDYNITPNLLLFARWNIDSTRLLSPYGLFATNVFPYVADSEQSHVMRLWNASLNWVASPTMVNQVTVASYEPSLAISTSPNAARSRAPGLTIPTVYNAQTDSASFIPSISLSNGYTGVSIIWPQNIGGYTYEIIDNFSWIKGRHSIKLGGSIDMEEKAQNNSNPNNNGSFTFSGSATGDSLADFLTGRAFQYSENSAHVFGNSQWTNYSLYAQDQIRVNDRLNLTLGLRWEYFQPEQDNNGLFSIFLPSRFDQSKAAVVQPNGQIVTGTQNFGNGIVISGTPENPFGNAAFNSTYNTFAPRGGFSYTLNKRGTTVLRGGFGMFHDRWSQFVSSLRNNYPFNQAAQIFSTQLSNPGAGERRFFPIGLTNFTSPWNIPYLMKWSMGVQQQLPLELLLDVSYVGSRGVALLRTRDINQPIASTQVASGALNVNAARPYPGFAGISSYETSGNSIYHSLQTSLTRRFSSGFAFQGSYTWSRTIDNAVTPINSYAANAMERAVSSFDRTHVLVVSYVYELPFARNSKGLARHLFQGWQISGINSFESGNPLTITIPGDRAGVGSTSQRPDIIAPITMDRTLRRWFSPESFAQPALGTFGNAGRSIVRGPGINNWDVSFSKRTELSERLTLQFRAEFFNVLNHTQYSGVGTSFGAATLGQVTSARDPRITQLGLRLQF